MGTCLFAYGRRAGELCRRDSDCESGLLCAEPESGGSARVCRPPVRQDKQYSESCNMSSECDISRGLCCQLQRRHRQAPRKVRRTTVLHSMYYVLNCRSARTSKILWCASVQWRPIKSRTPFSTPQAKNDWRALQDSRDPCTNFIILHLQFQMKLYPFGLPQLNVKNGNE